MELVHCILRGKTDLTEDGIEQLSSSIQELYSDVPNVVEIRSSNVIFVGDLHGELHSAHSVRRYMDMHRNHQFVFLGDYADRGPEQIDTFNLVIALALENPERVLMLRGNHESDEIAARYGFYDAVASAYSSDVFRYYSRVFEVLPIAAYSEGLLFACHGGVPENVRSVEEIQGCRRRDPNFPDDIIFQMVWNDPREGAFKFRPSERGERQGRAKLFGQEAFDQFMEDVNARIMFRAHEVFPSGCQTFFQSRLVSIFSATYGTQVNPKVVRFGSDLQIEPLSL